MKNNRIKQSVKILLGVAVLLMLLRIAAPFAIEKGVNYALSTTPGLSGHIGDVDIALYRGAYQIQDIALYLKDGEQQQPLLNIKQVDISVLWSALLNGSVVAKMRFLQPEIYYADDTSQVETINDDAQNEQTWIDLANRLVPFAIDRIDIEEGRVIFVSIDQQRRAETTLESINGQINNLTNSKDYSGTLVSNTQLSALIEGVCPLTLAGSYDPYASKPTFTLDVEMQRLPVKQIDGLIRSYAPFDLEAGEIDFAMEFIAEQGKVDGYLKAGIYDVTVFDWHEDVVEDGGNPFEWLFEGLTAAIATVFENGDKNLIATRVPLQGKINNIETPLWPTISSIIKNAFVKALDIKVDKVVKRQALSPVNGAGTPEV